MVAIIVQARVGSTRFPNKILYKINGKTLLEMQMERLKQCKLVDKIIIATTTNKNDDVICDIVKRNGLDCFRGSEEDLLDRYYNCALEYKADVVVRIGSDDIFMCPEIIDRAVDIYNNDKSLDLITNHFEPQSFPEGLELELYTFKTLEFLQNNAKLKSDREHVFLYIKNNIDKFHTCHFTQDVDQTHIRITLDYEEDFQLVKEIYKHWNNYDIIPLQKDIVKIIEDHPELLKINGNIKRYEGINKSIKEDGGELISTTPT